ncbi:isopentenyl-diphosphate Delta-isomerase [Aquisalimonas sp.]|uniref:isopentenyl-diphosphate Delta-isomerase n=1 Tax=Aquisalimonas sp. TaxID=1872621 RepID=UPI0025BC93C4|nr:isopentenyl-diphosphate Delta-isomerase [Aquisalimonas sp.]
MDDKRYGRHVPVSSDCEDLILVTPDDEEIGYLSKAACHDGEGVLHRAFSLFVFASDGSVLLQQRAADKRLWPGFWSNSCCSHPRRGESMTEAIERRAAEELGVGLRGLEYLYKFQYHARFGEAGSEHELCWVFLSRTDDTPRPNPHEIENWQWCAPDALDRALDETPETITPWCRAEWRRLREEFAGRVARYTGLSSREA